jgi:hypothetical protein
MAEAHVQLYGGEQDGYRTNIDLRGNTPAMFFIWRASDNETIALATGKKRMVLADRLAVLAYKFAGEKPKPGVPGDRELRYLRHAESDKKVPDAAL